MSRSNPVGAATPQRHHMLKCLTVQRFRQPPDGAIRAPRAAVRGRVLARAKFVAPDQTPTVDVWARPSAAELAQEVAVWTAGHRMRCHSGEPLEAVITCRFALEGDDFGFKPLSLGQFLGLLRDIRRKTLFFDLTAMACPFEVQLICPQPMLRNVVGEVESTAQINPDTTPFSPNPAHRPFLDWLAQVELDAPSSTLDAIFGDKVNLTIPCTKINLNPKERVS